MASTDVPLVESRTTAGDELPVLGESIAQSSLTTDPPTSARPAPPEVSITPATPVEPSQSSLTPPIAVPGATNLDGIPETSPTPPVAVAAPAASSSRAVPLPRPAPAVKKRRKRTFLSSLLLSCGCLDAAEFEDDPSHPVASREEARKMAQAITPDRTRVGSADAGGSAVGNGTGEKDPIKEQQAETTETTGTTLVGHEAEKSGELPGSKTVEDVVVAPIEPVTPPVDEVGQALCEGSRKLMIQTAGVTSSAVQPPGSGSSLLSTPHRATLRDSEGSPSDRDRTSTSGGYTDISESGGVDESSGAAAGEQDEGEYGMEEEYEDEEDRLIAQGGMGIPLDEVRRLIAYATSTEHAAWPASTPSAGYRID